MCLFKSPSVSACAWDSEREKREHRFVVWHPFFEYMDHLCGFIRFMCPKHLNIRRAGYNACMLFDDKTRERVKLQISSLLHLSWTYFFLSFFLLFLSHPIFSLSSRCTGWFTPPLPLFFLSLFLSSEQATRTPLRRCIRRRLCNTLHFHAPLTIELSLSWNIWRNSVNIIGRLTGKTGFSAYYQLQLMQKYGSL